MRARESVPKEDEKSASIKQQVRRSRAAAADLSAPTAGREGASCDNSNPECASWAMIGECQKNPRFMLSSCALACKACKQTKAEKEASKAEKEAEKAAVHAERAIEKLEVAATPKAEKAAEDAVQKAERAAIRAARKEAAAGKAPAATAPPVSTTGASGGADEGRATSKGFVWLPAEAAPPAALDPREARIRAKREARFGASKASSGAANGPMGAQALTKVAAASAVPSTVRDAVGVFNASLDSGRDRMGRWHAQAGQDRSASALLGGKRGGFFLDLASNEPIILSNTRALERDFGFRGICIEANPFYWQGLSEVRSCSVVGAAIAAEAGEVKFRAFRARGQSRNSGIVGRGFDNKNVGAANRDPIVNNKQWWVRAQLLRGSEHSF